jgi:broad specificity phosphatase PhoE
MKKTIHFVRHSEACHNRDAKKFNDFYEGRHLTDEYIDSKLSTDGIIQSQNLKILLKSKLPSPDLVVSSTLSRAIQTARIAYPSLRIFATDKCIERRAENVSDKRSNISDLKINFDNIDFEPNDHDEYHLFDSDKETKPTPFNSDKCTKRAREFINFLFTRPEQNIIVFTHSVFLYHLVKAENLSKNIKFGNGKLYTFTFERS